MRSRLFLKHTPQLISISSANSQEGEPAPGEPKGMFPAFCASTFIYRVVVFIGKVNLLFLCRWRR